MVLLLDCGNTHTVFGCADSEGKLSQIFRMETNRKKTGFEYASDIRQIFALLKIDPDSFCGAVISSVVPQLTEPYRKALRMAISRDALVIGPGIRTGLRIRIDDPGTIAPDLVAGAVAAKAKYPLPAIIIDMGTATTITVVDQNGDYIGGVILPGVGISMNALASETSLLPSIDVAPSKKLIATSTGDAMRSGIVYGTAGALDGIIDRFLSELHTEATLLGTGGLAGVICPYCRHKILVDEELLLHGLWHLFRLNESETKRTSRES